MRIAESASSGFDMTQFSPMHEMVEELVDTCLKHRNVTLVEPLSRERCMEVMKDSRLLDVEVGQGAVTYKAEGRASGDGWTTFGNTVLMMSYWLYTLHLSGISKHMLLVKGDDVLLAVETKEVPLLQATIPKLFHDKQSLRSHGLGQICKFVKFGSIEEMDFLSCYFFYKNDGKLRMTRIPGRVFQTIGWSTKVPVNCNDLAGVKKQLCFSKGHSLLAWSKGLPMFELLAKKMISLGSDGKYKDFNKEVDPYRVWRDEDSYEEFSSFLFERFGMCPAMIHDVEKRISNIMYLDELIDCPEIACLFE